MSSKNDTKYLKLVNGKWYFQKRLPDSLRSRFGGAQVINRSLNTDSLTEAKRLKNQWLVHIDNEAKAEASSPAYSKMLEQFRGMTQQQVAQAYAQHSESLSEAYPWIGHEQDSKDLPRPTDQEELKHQTLRHLTTGDAGVEDKYRVSLKQCHEAVEQELATRGLAPKTVNKYQNSVNIFLRWLGKDDIYAYAIDRGLVRKFITEQKALHEEATIRNYLSNLSILWDYARDSESLNISNPFANHKGQFKKRTRKQKYFKNFTIDELRKIIECLNVIDRLPIYISWYTGSRLDEVYSLKKGDIRTDEATGILYMSFKEEGDGKNEFATRKIPVHTKLRPYLKDFQGFLRPTSDAYGKVFSRAKRKVGISDERKCFHSIRGNVSTNFENLGLPEHIANKIVGHKSKGDTMTYGYYSEGLELKELDKYVNQLPVL
mgnify:CR=1 FL=1